MKTDSISENNQVLIKFSLILRSYFTEITNEMSLYTAEEEENYVFDIVPVGSKQREGTVFDWELYGHGNASNLKEELVVQESLSFAHIQIYLLSVYYLFHLLELYNNSNQHAKTFSNFLFLFRFFDPQMPLKTGWWKLTYRHVIITTVNIATPPWNVFHNYCTALRNVVSHSLVSYFRLLTNIKVM